MDKSALPPEGDSEFSSSLMREFFTPTSTADKAELRRSLLKTRQSLAMDVWREKSDRLCAHLQADRPFNQAQTILAYFSIRQEPDLSSLFSLPKRWGFPRCVEKSLIWHCWSPGDRLQTGAFGIQEPFAESPMLQPEQVDCILVPCVACDDRGFRLGYGGGFYDRLLSSPGWSSKATIGIVFEIGRLSQLPIDAWDRPLDGVCTENGCVF